jgi:hypothetical protein
MWSQRFEKCQSCGTTELKHRAKGLCVNCYGKETERKHKAHPRKRGIAGKKLTKEYLLEQYLGRKRSLSDIAKECGCSRQYVYKRLTHFDLQLRSKPEARRIALRRRKISFEKEDGLGRKRTIVHKEILLNENFFSSWSVKMAYVLGFIYADGSLDSRGSVSISQKDTEILTKIKNLMDCNAKLYFRPRKEYEDAVSGELYTLQINNHQIYNDLINLGLTPDKTFTVGFPQMSPLYVRHFIRGCWDGDGSVSFDRWGYIEASYTSGSRSFIKGMLSELEKAGFPKRRIFRHKQSSVSCEKLYHYLYSNVKSDLFLERKHDVFRQYADYARINRRIRELKAEGMRLSKIAQTLRVPLERVYNAIRITEPGEIID